MKGFVELNNVTNSIVLLPLGSFEVWKFPDGTTRIYNSNDDDISFECKESYEEVKALIVAAQKEV